MKQSRNVGFSEETRQFLHGARADYCIYGDGTITRTWKKSLIEEKVKIYMHHGKAVAKCGNRELIVKHIVAAAFLPGYKKGASVVCIDGNERNVAAENICIVKKEQLGRLTGHKSRSQAITVKNLSTGEIKKYRSVRRCALALNCSYQTVLDYVSGKVKNSVLSGYKIKAVANNV